MFLNHISCDRGMIGERRHEKMFTSLVDASIIQLVSGPFFYESNGYNAHRLSQVQPQRQNSYSNINGSNNGTPNNIRRHRGRTIIAVILAILLIVGAGGLGLWVKNSWDTANKALQNYVVIGNGQTIQVTAQKLPISGSHISVILTYPDAYSIPNTVKATLNGDTLTFEGEALQIPFSSIHFRTVQVFATSLKTQPNQVGQNVTQLPISTSSDSYINKVINGSQSVPMFSVTPCIVSLGTIQHVKTIYNFNIVVAPTGMCQLTFQSTTPSPAR